MKKSLLLFCFLCIFPVGKRSLAQQKDPAWDDTQRKDWPSEFREVDITSSADGKPQKAFLYRSSSKQKQPLIVSLHTWSGDYRQRDPLAREILARNWNYIHPDFRGINNKPDATGSRLVISDIQDAIVYALKSTNADPEEVHIVGVSGGGFATLAAYMNLEYPVNSFSAWAPISDLNAWYWESLGRKQRYANDILRSVSVDSVFNEKEARERSPLFQNFPKNLRASSKLFIYEGIHDGYTGSVPITHAIQMYNRLVGEHKYQVVDFGQIAAKANEDTSLVSQRETIDLVTRRTTPVGKSSGFLFDRRIHLAKHHSDVSLTIFEGGHEQIPQALGLVPVGNRYSKRLRVLVIGDSNAKNAGGWVDQLALMAPGFQLVNISQSGRTIGFDNNGRKELNALAGINNFLSEAEAQAEGQPYDVVLVCLGTNDVKNEFDSRQEEVPKNLELLLEKVKNSRVVSKNRTRLVYVSPPPVRTAQIAAKYEGAGNRLTTLLPRLRLIAQQKGFLFVNVHDPLLGILDYYAADGVHMAPAGQRIVASRILEVLVN